VNFCSITDNLSCSDLEAFIRLTTIKLLITEYGLTGTIIRLFSAKLALAECHRVLIKETLLDSLSYPTD